MRQTPKAEMPVKKSAIAHEQLTAKIEKTTFFQKLRDTAHPKPSWWVTITDCKTDNTVLVFCIIIDSSVKLGPVANICGCFNCHPVVSVPLQ